MNKVYYEENDFDKYITQRVKGRNIRTTFERKRAKQRQDVSLGDIVVFRFIGDFGNCVGRVYKIDKGEFWVVKLSNQRGSYISIDEVFISPVRENGRSFIEYKTEPPDFEGISLEELQTYVESEKKSKKEKKERELDENLCPKCVALKDKYTEEKYGIKRSIYGGEWRNLCKLFPCTKSSHIHRDGFCHYNLPQAILGSYPDERLTDFSLNRRQIDQEKKTLYFYGDGYHNLCRDDLKITPVDTEDSKSLIESHLKTEVDKFQCLLHQKFEKLDRGISYNNFRSDVKTLGIYYYNDRRRNTSFLWKEYKTWRSTHPRK